jgi:predicted nucleotidyltransferase
MAINSLLKQDVISEKDALKIVYKFIDEITKINKEDFLAVYLIGSLGGGYYRPGQSDIDTLILVKDESTVTQIQLDKIAEKYCQKYNIPKGFGSIMVYEHELFPPYEKSISEDFEFTVEIARLKIQGKLIFGTYDLNNISMPNREYLIRDALIMEKWFDKEYGHPMFNKLGITGSINCILSTMRRCLMIEKKIFEFNKFNTINVYLKNDPEIIDENIFLIINKYLHNEITNMELYLSEIRDFGTKITDYYNKKLLGIKKTQNK